MGAEQSKGASSGEDSPEKVLYSDQANVQFSQDLLNHLSSSVASPTPTPERQQTLDTHVRARIQAEMERLRAEEADVVREVEAALARENLDREVAQGEAHSELLGKDMEEVRRKVERFERGKTLSGEGREEVKERREAVVRCYAENKNRPLDCWREVEAFKESVAVLEQRYIQSFR